MDRYVTNAPGAEAFGEARTRRDFFKVLAEVGVGAVASSALLPREASAQAAASDINILNFALTIEYFESEVFYPAALNAGILSGEALAVVRQLVAIEEVHRDTLIAGIRTLGGTPIPRPQYVVPPAILANQQTFLQAARQQEMVDVGANLGVGPMIQNPDILAAAGAIAGQESENVVTLKNLLGVAPPANEALPAALTKDQVLAAVAPFLASVAVADNCRPRADPAGPRLPGRTARYANRHEDPGGVELFYVLPLSLCFKMLTLLRCIEAR